ncbi:MAG: hypothetical protein KGD73_01460 [Candidatus Lokiarchaeota archaeon]|nr:hypothetical protein [Candidatus Lokiarchaeota archaeon]
MITGFAIILDEEILYVSNENKYAFFEIVLFIEKLIKSINPKNYWRLKNIFFENDNGRERMIIKHLITENNENLFYCITGDFISGSEEADRMLDEYIEKVSANYPNAEAIEKASSKSEFSKIVKLITAYLWDKYRDPIADEELIGNCLSNNNKILYCGISTQGLPIISKLYDDSLLQNIKQEASKENIDIFTSNLSAKLATITMNTQIRAKSHIKEIHFDDLGNDGCMKLILYSKINNFSLDLIASGDLFKIKEIFSQLESKISKEEILLSEFNGDLKPYRTLSSYLDEIINEFDQ